MIRHECQQNSDAWQRLRLGIPTSSCFHRIITPAGKPSKQAAGYMHRLLAEWIIGEPLDDYQSEFMQRGQALEDQAVRSYCFETNSEVEKVGFITDDSGMMGCSPDRLIIGQRGGLEIKCPMPWTHVGNMVERAIDDDHRCQVQGQMLVAELDWVDVQSYCPGLPSVIIRAKRDEKFIKELSISLRSFVETMQNVRLKLTQQYGPFTREMPRQEIRTVVDGLGVTDDDARAIWEASQRGR